MRKIFLLLSIFSLHLYTHAQEFDVGVKGGINYVSLRGTTSEVSTFKSKLGVYVGA